jgi:hypothetical protein
MTEPTKLENSRRDFLTLILASVSARRAVGQKSRDLPPEALREIKPIKAFGSARLCSLSPDGQEMCVYFTRHPNMTFNLRNGGKGRIASGNSEEEELALIRLGIWDAVYSDQERQGPPGDISFFAEGEAFYEDTVFFRPDGYAEYLNVVVNLKTMEKKVRPRFPHTGNVSYRALRANTLLGTDSNTSPFRHNVLTRIILPDYRELGRVPFAVPDGKEQDGYETFPFISADRQTLAYAFGHTIVCRRTKDCEVLWTQPVEKAMFGARRLAVSSTGSRIAVAVIDSTIWDQQKQFYVAIYDGQNGRPVAKLSLNGDHGLAVSPDGRLLAIGKRIATPNYIQLRVECYDIESGQLISVGTHDRVPPGRFQILNAQFDSEYGLQYTADGKYLITSSNNNIKVWKQ